MSEPDFSTAGDARSLRGLHLAQTLPIKPTTKGWVVPSQSGKGKYTVALDMSGCTCPDFETRQAKCKHIYAVEVMLEGIDEPDDIEVPETKAPVTYSQNWPAYNAAQTNKKAMFQTLLYDLCQEIAEPARTVGKAPGGRRPLYYRDMVFCIAFKVYTTVSSRRFISDLRDAQSKGYIGSVPHFNSIFNYLDEPELTPLLQQLIVNSSLPLKTVETDFAVDSSGFSTNRFVRWYNVKYGREVDNHDWVKLHLMTGVKTNIVSSVEISGRHDHDAPFFPGLVGTTAVNFRILEVSADKAYSSRANLHAVTSHGATPFIPFKSNATGEAGGDNLWRIMYHYYSLKRSEFLGHYHKRSNVESTFSMIKGKFGDAVRGKTETAQINEILLKVLCHNICCLIQSFYELGIEPSFCAESPVAQKLG